jgi:hypothetical protein
MENTTDNAGNPRYIGYCYGKSRIIENRVIIVKPATIPVNYERHGINCQCGNCNNTAGIVFK